MKRYFNKLMTCALACAICLSAAVPALAAESNSELTTAAAYLREKGIIQRAEIRAMDQLYAH